MNKEASFKWIHRLLKENRLLKRQINYDLKMSINKVNKERQVIKYGK